MIRLLIAIFFFIPIPLLAQLSKAYMADAVAGPIVPPAGEGADARQALLLFPVAVVVDSANNVYILDQRLNRVLKVAPSGAYRLAAGSGNYSSAPTDLAAPSDMAIDKQDNLYIADKYRSRIVKVSATGEFSTVAGGGTNSGDGFGATDTKLGFVDRVAVDGQGNVYFTEDRIYKIRRVAMSTGKIETVAGTGTNSSTDAPGLARNTSIGDVNSMTFDSAGNLYFLDSYGNKLKKVGTDGNMSLVFTAYETPWKTNAAVKANLQYLGIVIDPQGTLYLTNENEPFVIKCPSMKDCELVAGGGGTKDVPIVRGFDGDGAITSSRRLSMLHGMARDAQGNLYITEDHRVRKIAGGQITTVAGTTAPEAFNGGQSAKRLIVTSADGMVRDKQGNLYFSDFQNARVWKIGTDGKSAAFAGTGVAGYSGDGGLATLAELDTPGSLAIDPSGNVYIVDYQNNVIRKVDGSGRISTVAGTSFATRRSCDPYATTATRGVDICATGLTKIVADATGIIFGTYPNLWRVNADGSARSIPFPAKYVSALAFDPQGNLYVSSYNPAQIWRGNTSGTSWTVIAGTGKQGLTGDGGQAVNAQVDPSSIAFDDKGYLYFGNPSGGPRLRYIAPDGTVNTLTGWKNMGTPGMGGPATDLRVTPNSIAVANGMFYMTDSMTSSNVLNNISAWSLEPAQIFRTGTVNAASYAGGMIAPGEMVTIYGVDIGPPALAMYQVTDGRFATEIASTRVMVNGTPMPIIYASSGAVSTIMPFGLTAGSEAEVWIEYQGKATNHLKMPVIAAFPGVFTIPSTGSGQAAMQHWPDYSINGASNPIAREGVAMVYLTAGGMSGTDGALADSAQSHPLPVDVRVGTLPTQVLYAGTSPGLVHGMMQINFIVPANAATGDKVPLSLKIGERWAQLTLTMAIK